MEIFQLKANNLKALETNIPLDKSLGIGGLSGSGKSTFCSAVADESLRRIVTLLPKTEYRFLFGEQVSSNYSASYISGLPLIFYLGKSSFSSNPRSTVGTHTGVFKEVRNNYANIFKISSEFFSFNNSIMWCPKCKGRGSTSGRECKECGGTRYSHEILDYKISIGARKLAITEVNCMTAEETLEKADELKLSARKRKVLQNFIALDIGYLSLNRIMSTLSGGENVRVLLAEFMAECSNSLIIIDEISIGLDRDTLISVLKQVNELGATNTVWLIDHSKIVMQSTGGHLFFGPGSGENGGNIVADFVRPEEIIPKGQNFVADKFYHFENLQKRNIDLNELDIPQNRITVITGESGCGKSTLVKDCIIPYINEKYKRVTCTVIGQDRNQSITSRSTVATFLDLSKKLKKFDDDIKYKNIEEIYDIIKKDSQIEAKIKALIKLGLGYLSLNRKVQTLSTGEFQCLHLVSQMLDLNESSNIFIFDEPSKGLSQNILNLLMETIRSLINDTKNTVIIIEHNMYIIKSSDFVLDFGKRSYEHIKKLTVISEQEWIRNQNNSQNIPCIISSNIKKYDNKIVEIQQDVDEEFSHYIDEFKGGVLRRYSQTADWIYSGYSVDKTEPIIAIDLEERLYSKNTFLYEIGNIINSILNLVRPKETNLFDFYDKSNLCECCKGTGTIETINFSVAIANENTGIWDGLLHKEIMAELKRYNYSKIKFLFREIKKESGLELDKSFASMSADEKNVFLYGYWENSFYDTTKKTQRKWKGIIHLIQKYMRSSNSVYKSLLNDTKHEIECPFCHGSILRHKHKLEICGNDIRDIVRQKISDNDILIKLKEIQRVVDILQTKDIALNSDVSELPIESQVKLKLLDIVSAKLYGFKIVLKNTKPFYKLIRKDLETLAQDNLVITLNYAGINKTKNELLNYINGSQKKIKEKSFVYEILGYKKIITEINKVRKRCPCKYCKGKKVLIEESIFENVDSTETPCNFCNQTGISNEGLDCKVENIPVKTWLIGKAADLKADLPKEIGKINPCLTIRDLNKNQITEILRYIGEDF